MIITLDGPTASGKSTIARLLARDFKSMHINTGLLYRALAYILIQEYAYTIEDLPQSRYPDVVEIRQKLKYTYTDEQGGQVLFKEQNITSHLKSPHIDRGASYISTNINVRAILLEFQRSLGDTIVADGRDCGAVVFSHADYKFFLTADPEIRARRWYNEQRSKGIIISFDEAFAALCERDTRDSTRHVAPLIIPPDARIIDNSHLTIEQTCTAVKGFIR